ncbi:snRNA-activating protein complex subunit 2 [Suncus etruscus]|uniref:snRNA-activating protein complex subunit 2 n=1 Tax=Suncus etruscus TaxID=109475 RepID=UPI002110A685|nr:snRNA-activating protein complex subunit 2 [Suncus etruscus]
MKPPQRRRAAPARYLEEASARPAIWSSSERRQLLRLLQARRGRPELEAAELARELPGRSEAEVKKFLWQLKGRVTREAFQRLYPGGAQGPRCRGTQTPAPIEVWIDLAEKITGPLEETLMAAFSQVFTIAATEPVSLLHSIPPKPTLVRGRPLILSIPGKQAHPTTEPSGPAAEAPRPASDPLDSSLKTPGPTSEVPSPTPEVPGPTPSVPAPAPRPPGSTPTVPSPTPPAPLEGPEDLTVDFEKIYKYLSSLTRSGLGPELSAAESAVVLDLLMALPEELKKLPCEALVQHMLDMYQHLTDPQPDPADVDVGVTDARTDSGPQEEASPSPSQAEEPRDSRPQEEASSTPSQAEEPRDSGPQEEASSTPSQAEEPRDSSSHWKVPGVCPLNPFLVPLELLGRVSSPAQ